MVKFFEILNVDAENEDQMYIMLENGEWCSEEMSRADDLEDLLVFENEGREKPDGRYICIGTISRWKNDTIKSRVCLQDVALVYTLGGELFAATPSLTLRTSLTIASELIITRVPKAMNGLTIAIEEKEFVLYKGLEMVVESLVRVQEITEVVAGTFLESVDGELSVLEAGPGDV